MIRNKLLLQGNPTYVLAPDIELTQNIVTKSDKENSEGPFNCDGCGKALNSEYYILIGIPPSQLIVDSFPCKSSDNENHSVERHMSDIRFMLSELNTSDSIKDEYQWIFSEQNIASSKTRVCVDCFTEHKLPSLWEFDDHSRSVFTHYVFFAVKEYQRRHTPINSTMSDLERYIISLPDRSDVHWVGPAFYAWGWALDENCNTTMHFDSIAEFLRIALFSNHDLEDKSSMLTPEYSRSILQELRTDFIQDKDRKIPNDQELGRWMKKHFTDHEERGYVKAIDSCKVFANPKTDEYDHKRVVLHYIDGDWDEIDV